MTTLDPNIYRQAADEISTHGHVKDAFVGPNGEHCVNGAIMAALNSDEEALDLDAPLLAEMLGKPPLWIAVAEWNDAPERTPEDCIALLQQAAEKLEADR